ncbi:GNAT family N-acetyltransferase [Streptomyces sp. NPDC059837]|uniref:GNAT family N-acetyltransferase n=1 Tax=Streptomyces sp. NPDC059837 TaxID=3346968 RepID=UPI0036525100
MTVASPGGGRAGLARDRERSEERGGLARKVLAEVGPAYRPLGEARLIDALAAQLPDPEPDHHYLWMETDSRPGTMSGEVEWLDADQALRAGPLFDRFFPGSYAKQGASAHRWAEAVAEPDGEPLAVAADAWSARGCGYLAGVVTHPDARGRGLSRAVCGFVLEQVRTPDHHSRRLLRPGSRHGPGHHVLAEHLDPQPAHRPHRPPAHPEADDGTTITELLAEFADRKSPREAKMVGLLGDRKPTPEELHEAGEPSRFLLFRLQT